MNNHIQESLINSYADGMLSSADSERVQSHLSECDICNCELQNIRDIKRRLAVLPSHRAPQELISRLKKTYLTPSVLTRIQQSFYFGWKPVSAFALLTLLFGLWFFTKNNVDEDTLSLEPLLAAHSRYEAENLVPGGDMMASNFSAQLAVYYGEKE